MPFLTIFTSSKLCLDCSKIKAREDAIIYLVKNIPKKTWKDFKQNPKRFLVDHRGFGLHIRNLLRQSGYNPGSIALDDEWEDLVKEAFSKVPEEIFFSYPRCDYCGKIIEGLPYYDQHGQTFCADHKVPETRGGHGYRISQDYRTINHSDGTTEYRK